MEKTQKRRIWLGQGREINVYLVFAEGQSLCVMRLWLFRHCSRKGLVTGWKGPIREYVSLHLSI